MAASVSSSPPPSPSYSYVAVVYDRSEMSVVVKDGFSWDDLKTFLNKYLAEVKDDEYTSDCVAKEFCERLEKWLQEPDGNETPRQALESWQKEINEMDDGSTTHFPKIAITQS